MGVDSATALLETVIESESFSTCESTSSWTLQAPLTLSQHQQLRRHRNQRRHRGRPARHSNVLSLARGKRSRPDLQSMIKEMQAERNRAQLDQHIQLLLGEAHEAREHEAALQREEMAQNATFNQEFLSVLGKLVQAI